MLIQCGHCKKGMNIQQSGTSLPLLRCSNKQRLGAKRSGCKLLATFPYVIADFFYNFYVEKTLLNELTVRHKNESANIEKREITFKINRLKKRLAAERKRYDTLFDADKDFDLAYELMQESTDKIKILEKREEEVNQALGFSSKHEISIDIFKLAENSEKLNLMLHKIGFKMTINNKVISYSDSLSLEYINYCRKEKRYFYKNNNGEGGYISNEGRTPDSFLQKPVLNSSERKVLDQLREGYTNAVVNHAAGETILLEDIFPNANS